MSSFESLDMSSCDEGQKIGILRPEKTMYFRFPLTLRGSHQRMEQKSTLQRFISLFESD